MNKRSDAMLVPDELPELETRLPASSGPSATGIGFCSPADTRSAEVVAFQPPQGKCASRCTYLEEHLAGLWRV
jgi:hypothetical protein